MLCVLKTVSGVLPVIAYVILETGYMCWHHEAVEAIFIFP